MQFKFVLILLAHIGNLRMNCFLLQILSQERNFGIQLNQPIDMNTLGAYSKLLPNFSNGCWADVLFLSIYVLLSTNSPIKAQLNQLQESYLATMANCAPLITKFNSITAQKVHSLFTVFSSPRFLLSKERNHIRLFYFLYTIDTILQYQYQGNVDIVYCFVRDKERVLALRDLTFEKAVEIANQSRGVTGNDSTNNSADTPTLSSANSDVEFAAMSEKARGKLPRSGSISTAIYQSTSGFQPTPSWVRFFVYAFTNKRVL